MKIKRIAFSFLSCFALLVSSLPSSAVFISAGAADKTPEMINIQDNKGGQKTFVFANGIPITVESDGNGANIVKFDGGQIDNVPVSADVFGGSHNDDTSMTSDITIDGAHLNTVYGGGLHKSHVTDANIVVKGNADLKWVCGGGANCLVEDDCSKGTDSWQTNNAANSKTVVEKAEITIENGTVANDVYGGGEGFSKTENTTVNIKGGTLNSVCASGSNGYTGNSEVNIENGTITYVYSVNRGNLEKSAVTVTGGTITNLYIGAANYSNITGTVKNSNVKVTGGKVENFAAGKSGDAPLDVNNGGENYKFSVSGDADVNYDGTVSEDKNSALASKMTYLQSGDFQNAPNTAPILFANGNSITVTPDPDKEGMNRVTCDKDGSFITIPKNASIFAGSHNSDQEVGPVTITIDGAEINNVVWGGGMHKSHVTNATIVVKSGSKVKAVQGGGAATNSAIKQCVVDCDGAIKDSDGERSTCIVDAATITIEDGATVSSVFGGGEGYSNTTKTTVNIEGGDIEFVGAGGSNGYTGEAEVNIKGGNIGLVQSVNRGKMNSAEFKVSGENTVIDKFYVGGEDADDVKGSITKSNVTVSGGTINSLSLGKSGDKAIDSEAEGTFKATLESAANVTLEDASEWAATLLECKHHFPLTRVSSKKAATCTEKGAIDAWQCPMCEKYFKDASAETPLDDVNQDQKIDLDDTITEMIEHTYVSHTVAVCDGASEAGETYTYYSCSVCGKFFTDKNRGSEIDSATLKSNIDSAAKHNSQVVPGKVPTCKDAGYTDSIVCSVCGDTLVEKETLNRDFSNHAEMGEWSSVPEDDLHHDIYPGIKDCTVGGWQIRKCTACGSYEYRYVEPTEHTWGEPVKGEGDSDATCTEPGSKTKTCEVCGMTEKVTVDALDHDLQIVAKKDATCTEAGNKRYWKCSRCDDYFNDALGNEKIEDKNSVNIEALGHSWETVPEKAPTCSDTGMSEYTQCQRCQEYDENGAPHVLDINPNNHKFGDEQDELKEATCTEAGSYKHTCQLCSKEFTVDLPATGHTFTNHPKVEAQCTTEGTSEYWECDNCGKKFLTDDVNALPETAVEDDALVIEATNHPSIEKVEAKAAECETAGNNAYWYCPDCGKYFADEEGHAKTDEPKESADEFNVVAKGHNQSLNKNDVEEPNCGEDGHIEYYVCPDCGKWFKDEHAQTEITEEQKTQYEEQGGVLKKATGSHQIDEGKVTEPKDPTCTQDGNLGYAECQTCHKLIRIKAKLPTGWEYDQDEGLLKDREDDDDEIVTADDAVIPATNHPNKTKHDAAEATCETEGAQEYYQCDDCQAYFFNTAEAEAAPVYVEVESGVDGYVDRNNNQTVDDADFVIPAKGHDYGTEIGEVAASCTDYGTMAHFKCSRCNKLFVTDTVAGGPDNKREVQENELQIPPLNHATKQMVDRVEPQCKNADADDLVDGHIRYWYCDKCNKYFFDANCTMEITNKDATVEEGGTVIPASHTWGSWESDVEPTCSSTGIQKRTCKVCGKEEKRDVNKDPTKHSNVVNDAEELATCTKPGKTAGSHCEACGAVIVPQYATPLAAHKPVTDAAVDATCTKSGLTEGSHCSECNGILQIQVVTPALGHDFKTYNNNNDATCTENGTETAKCERCDAKDTREIANSAKGHNFDEGVVTSEATCTANGVKTYTCKNECGSSYTEVIPMIPHTPVVDEAVEATCTKTGLSEGSHCSECGGIIVARAITPSKGHSYKNGVCTVCGTKDPNYSVAVKPVKVLKITQAKVTQLKVKSKGKNKININWKKVNGAKGYEIEVSKSSSFKVKAKVLTKSTKKLKLVIKNKKLLKSGKIYYVRARAYTTYKDANGAIKKAYSNWNYVLRKVKVK